MQEEKLKRKNRQADGGAKDRYRRVQSDIERQKEKAERSMEALDADEVEALAGEIERLLADVVQAEEGSKLCGATKHFDVTLKQRGSRLMISAVRREDFLEENREPDLTGESL